MPEALRKIPGIKAFLALLVVYLVWGTTYGAIHIGVETLPPAWLGCLRFSLAGLLLIGWSVLRGQWRLDVVSLKRELLIGFLLFFAGNSISFWAIQHVPTGLAGTLVATNPFWMTALSALLPPREKIHPLAWVGLVIGFAGIAVLLFPKLSVPQSTDGAFWLSLLGLLVMVFFWGLGSVMVRKWPSQTPLPMALGIQNVFAGLLLMPLCAISVPFSALHPSPASLWALAYLMVFGTILATSCYYYCLDRLPVAVAGTFAYITPLITVLFGWLFLGESITPFTVWGTAIILGGVVLVQWVSLARPERQIESLPALKPLQGALPAPSYRREREEVLDEPTLKTR